MNILLPKQVDNKFEGRRVIVWVFMAIAVISTVRSCIHIFATDGGANSIASLSLESGAENIIFAFGLWGVSQLVYALIQLIIAFRYNKLVPLMYVILILETLGRMLIGLIKAPILAHTPPGAIGNYVMLPLALIMLILAFIPQNRKNRAA